ncbi:MAG TPA: Uma2 family endonuclease [Vicinamibacterales bacterium]|nr:Uma2 family endonuclease [Vicinamibacterales bacterium]
MRSPAARADMRLTYDDFALFPDDGKRHEIIDGEHVVTPSPNVRHQVLVGRLFYDLEHYFRSQPQAGQVFTAPLDVLLSPYDIVEPDLLVVTGDQAGILTEKNVQGPPALVIEVLSKSTRKRDAQTKRRLFERSGVREYWLVDPELDAVQVFRPTLEGRLARVVELTAEDGDVLATPLLPGFQIDLRELFRSGR